MKGSWQRRRREFNHDWLRNGYVPALEKWLNVLDGEVRDPYFESEFVRRGLLEWEEWCEEARSISYDFEDAASPRAKFLLAPLCSCPPETKQWLPEFVHALWRSRHHVDQLVHQAVMRVEGTDRAYLRVKEALAATMPASVKKPLRSRVAELTVACSDLAMSISAFPTDTRGG